MSNILYLNMILDHPGISKNHTNLILLDNTTITHLIPHSSYSKISYPSLLVFPRRRLPPCCVCCSLSGFRDLTCSDFDSDFDLKERWKIESPKSFLYFNLA